MADNSVEIAHIKSILNAGTASVSHDGTSVRYDFDALRKRLSELELTDDATIAAGNVRPRSMTIRVGRQ